MKLIQILFIFLLLGFWNIILNLFLFWNFILLLTFIWIFFLFFKIIINILLLHIHFPFYSLPLQTLFLFNIIIRLFLLSFLSCIIFDYKRIIIKIFWWLFDRNFLFGFWFNNRRCFVSFFWRNAHCFTMIVYNFLFGFIVKKRCKIYTFFSRLPVLINFLGFLGLGGLVYSYRTLHNYLFDGFLLFLFVF